MVDSQIKKEHESINSWANSIIESAKALILNGEVYVLGTRGRPWYRAEDSWIEDSWWVTAAKIQYDKYCDTDLFIAEELEVLVKYDPDSYREDARSRISRWYDQNFNHDCESRIDLAMLVYPEHEIFQEIYENISGYSYTEKIILAHLGYPDLASQIRSDLLEYFNERESFWLNNILIGLAMCGGKMLVQSIISADELQLFRSWIRSIAEQDFALFQDGYIKENDYSSDRSISIRTAVLLDWQDVIDALAQNNSYLQSLDVFDVLWWSLTDKKDLVQNFILQYKFRPNVLSHIESEAMALAVAWKRSMI